MSDADQQNAKARERANQDMADISFLEKCDAFNRYWVRRLNEKYRAAQDQMADGKTPEDREAGRQRYKLLKELSGLPAEDKVAAQKFLNSAAPSGAPRAPTQVG